MFIEYDITEEDVTYKALINVNHIVCLTVENISLHEQEFIIHCTNDTVRFYDKPNDLYEAFKRALCGESVIIEGIGYVRPLNAKTPSMGPITHMTWRNFP